MILITLSSGIDVVRNKIKTFAQKKVTLPPGRHKIIILDEADRCVVILGAINCGTYMHLQYDGGCSTSATADNGNIFQHNTVLPCLQYEQQDH